jgi:alpha-1,2-mannosyltransferase
MPSRAARLDRAPARRAVRPPIVAQGGLIGAAAAIYGIVVISAGLHQQDVAAYLQGARDLVGGHPLYATFLQHPFPDPTLRPAYIYPPAFALLIAPLALLPSAGASVVWTVVNQVALVVAVALGVDQLRPTPWARAAIIAGTATFYPLWIDVAQGQANLVILLLVVAGLAGVVRKDDRWAAAWGVAAALKVSPALLLLWLLLNGRWRAAGWMIGGAATVTAIGFLIRAHDTLSFFGQVLPALAHGTAVYANQSLSGVLLRLTTVNPYTDPWVILGSPVIVIALTSLLAFAWWAWQTWGADPQLRLLAFLPLIPLVSAVTWPHHLVLLLPLLWGIFTVLGRAGWPRGQTTATALVLLVFSVLSRWPAGPAFGAPGFRSAQTTDPLVLLVSNALFLGTILLLLLSPWLLRSR